MERYSSRPQFASTLTRVALVSESPPCAPRWSRLVVSHHVGLLDGAGCMSPADTPTQPKPMQGAAVDKGGREARKGVEEEKPPACPLPHLEERGMVEVAIHQDAAWRTPHGEIETALRNRTPRPSRSHKVSDDGVPSSP